MNRTKFAILSILSSISLSVVLFGLPKDVATTFAYQNNDASTYYNDIGKYDTGNDLVNKLNTLNNQKRQRLISYDSMSQYFPQTDPGNSSGQVTSFYSGKSARFSGNMNREHVWPFSRLNTTGERGETDIEKDMHMIRPTLKSENASRGNSFFVEGEKDDRYGWDPAMEEFGDVTYRGDSARIIFYSAIADLDLSLADVNYEGVSKHSMGKLSHLLRWNLTYPVKAREKTRNEAVESLQGHRNPFIDHPEYACRIWGKASDEARSVCGSYGIEGQVKINNSDIVSDEYMLEIDDVATFTPSFSGNVSPTYTWSFSDAYGNAKSTDAVSIEYNGNEVSLKGLKLGTTYLKLQAVYTMDNGNEETIWKAIKISVVPRVDVISIQLTNFPSRISYYVGDTFNPAGIKILANFNDGSNKDVTDKVTYSNTNFDKAGTYTIFVHYKYKEIEVETSFNVYVRDQGGGGGDTPTPSSGCRGEIMSTSIILSSLSLVATFLVTVSIRKKKKK